jgi:hypothetical protein
MKRLAITPIFLAAIGFAVWQVRSFVWKDTAGERLAEIPSDCLWAKLESGWTIL